MSEATYYPPEEEAIAHDRDKSCFKEAVCIDAMRVYDSCGDKNCLEDLRVYFPKTASAWWMTHLLCGLKAWT